MGIYFTTLLLLIYHLYDVNFADYRRSTGQEIDGTMIKITSVNVLIQYC